MTKLVRDRIRLLANRRGENFNPSDFRLCDPDEYDALLLEKLDEELAEMTLAFNSSSELAEEIGDVIEVLFTIADRFAGRSRETILDTLEAKRAYKGGFDAGVVLVNG